MKKLLSSLFVSACVLTSALSIQAAESVTITDQLGSYEVPVNPKRVVALDYGALDIMDTLGVTPEIAVSQSVIPDYLSKYKSDKYTDLGSLKEFNMETVNAFKPDLIIISGRQQAYYDELVKIAPVYFVDRTPAQYLDLIKKDITDLGKIFDKEQKAKEAIKGIDETIARVKAKGETSDKKALILLTNDGKISAYGSGTRFGFIHDALAVPAADAKIEAAKHGQQVDYEYIAMLNPDVIYVVDRSIAIGQQAKSVKLTSNALVNRTKAAKNGKIIMLTPAIWYLTGGGIKGVNTMLSEIEKGLD